jgi:hypothetical protein
MKKEAYHKFGQLMRSFFYKHYVSILLANLLKTLIYQGFERLLHHAAHS